MMRNILLLFLLMTSCGLYSQNIVIDYPKDSTIYEVGYEYYRVEDNGRIGHWILIERVHMGYNACGGFGDSVPFDLGHRWRCIMTYDGHDYVECWTDDHWIDQGSPTLEGAKNKYLKRLTEIEKF